MNSLLFILNRIKEGTVDAEEINRLAAFSIKTALNYINFLKSKRQFLNQWGDDELEEVAVTSITPLFTKNSKGELGIVNSMNSWDTLIDSKSEAEFFTRKVIWNRVEQSLTNLLKERDPLFGKIANTINVGINNFGYIKTSVLGTVYIVSSDRDEIEFPLITKESFQKIPAHIFILKQEKLIKEILIYIEKNTEYFPAIPFNELIKRIKEIHLHGYDLNKAAEAIAQPNEIDEIVNNALENIIDEIKQSYVGKEKISLKEGEMIKDAFLLISEDMKNGGIKNGIFSYLQKVNPQLERSEYYDKLSGIMYYLFNRYKKIVIELWNY